tara:strand:+ start:1020 stop:1211 length:192 start_codon:yes stop_codon:yes gene_type:complete
MKKTSSEKKMSKVYNEYKAGTLHSGKGGPVVTSKKQATAIMLSEGGKAMPQRGMRTAKNKAKK